MLERGCAERSEQRRTASVETEPRRPSWNIRSEEVPQLAEVGAGYVGLVTAACLAELVIG